MELYEQSEPGNNWPRAIAIYFITEKRLAIRKDLKEIVNREKAMRGEGLNQAEIDRAKEHPFDNLIEFKHKSAMCPHHEGQTPALRWYPEKNTVHCFACNKTWDTIQWVREMEGCTFHEAVRRLQ
jgi:hypothetical protein